MQFFKKIVIKILILESKLILRKYKPFIVAVTGSVGKTSTKDAIYCVLKDQSEYVRKSDKSFNSEIGLPLTVIGVSNAWRSMWGWMKNICVGLKLIFVYQDYPDCLVLEIGADHPGDIKNITKWLKPDISVITKVSKTPVHVELFKSPEQVFEEKASLAEAVKKDGSLILFGDDAEILKMADRVKDKNVKVITYGRQNANVKGKNLTIEYKYDQDLKYPIGIRFDIEMVAKLDSQEQGASNPVSNPVSKSISISNVLGETYQYPILAAAAVGIAKGMDAEKIVKNLEFYTAPRGRMNLVPGINDSTVVDDTYNSSPDAVMSALQSLRFVETNGSKIAILGDMMELGKFAADEHRKIGREAATVVEMLITVGPRSRATADEAIRAGMKQGDVFSFDSSNDVVRTGMPVIARGDIVLVKGSQSVRMERIVKALLRNPTRAEELLVRQEKEWLDKA